MPRQARLDIPGTLHHVMIRGIERRNIFRNDRDRNDFINRLASLIPETQTSCYAWAFLPNHAHFLFRSGPSGIAHFMRKLLTGYVVSFNRRYHRSGQLFQNRYKSIICQEEVYFKELIRYIHLNPIRARIVSTLPELDRFPFSGHSALMGNKERAWQEKDYVLRFFADTQTEAQRLYRSFVGAGFDQGRREDLSGGGLLRSTGGWSEVKRQRERVKGDQRILGDSDFVLGLLRNAEEGYERQALIKSKGYTLEMIADQVASLYSIAREDILSKGREALRVEARSLFCYVAAHNLRISVTALARRLGMAASSISYAVRRGKAITEKKGFQLLEHHQRY
jgi:putative transposase